MKTTIQIILETLILAALIFIAALLWQERQPVKSEYAEFEWDKNLHNPALVFDGQSASYPVSSPARVMVVLSWNGWKLAWTDGTRYLVTRPEGNWHSGDFSLEEYK